MKRISKFAIIGVILALFNFAIYTFLARVVMSSNDLLWLDSMISYLLATILAYFLHSRVTWRERKVTKHGIAMFFLWNGITALLISPLFTWLFGILTPLYQLAHGIFTNIHIPFDYDFVESTGIFVLTTCVTMVLNYLFYDKLVFDDTYFQKIIAKIKSLTWKQVFAFLLYALPVAFSVGSMFLITTSGEDIFQGAGNYMNDAEVTPLEDARAAFEFNSRLTDMYAWSVIDYYDYQFNGGIDFFLRLVDAVAISGVFYLAVYLILGEKPRIKLRDAFIFAGVFVTFILTPFGRAFYHEFSMIHNYVPLALLALGFAIPYVNLVRADLKTAKSVKSPKNLEWYSKFFSKKTGFIILMLILGLGFGMSATITPLAFLLTVIIFCLVRRKSLSWPPAWFFSGIIGVIIGFLICWFAGSGVDHYTNPITAATFDYLPMSEILANPGKLLYHEIYNFALVFAPLLIVFILLLIYSKNRKNLFKIKNISPKTANFIIIFSLFIIIHILGASLVKAPPRLLIPAYLAGLVLLFRLFAHHLCYSKLSTSVLVIFTTVIAVTHISLLIKYRTEMAKVLEKIKTSEENALCISPEETRPTRVKLLDLAQANMLVDWGEPEYIYGKAILNCP